MAHRTLFEPQSTTLKHEPNPLREPMPIQDFQRRAYERLAPGRPAPRFFVEAEDGLRELWRDGDD
jgi:hypothetical protein